MPPVNILIKPASSACNLACEYCFYRDVAAHREHEFEGKLSLDFMEKVISSGMDFADDVCTFAFQGGEPTLAGIEFFEKTLDLQKKYSRPGVEIRNAIQTNGTLIDEEWAAFLAENHFLVGLSLDGPSENHNLNRVGKNGEKSFNAVMRAVRLFRKYQVDFNILCVLTGKNARSIEKIYSFCKKEKFEWLQFIPCLEPFDATQGMSRYALSAEDYGNFLVKIFRLWFADLQRGDYISIRHLDNWLSIMLGEPPEACNMVGSCSIQFVIEGNGGVYPCDFYVLDSWKLGTVGEMSFWEIMRSPKAEEFVTVSRFIPEKCKQCQWYPLCRNGCRRERDNDGLYRYCSSMQYFFSSCWKELLTAADWIREIRKRNMILK